VALAAVYVIWGSTYLAIRVMVETVPPLLGAGVRFVLAGALLLVAVGARRGFASLRMSRRHLAITALVGILLAAGGNGLVTVGEQDVPSGLAALIVASVPLWIVVFRALGRDRVSGATFAAVLLGFLGVGLLMLPGHRPEGVPLGASLLIVAAAASWGLGSFVAQRARVPADPLVATGWQMLAGGIVLLICGAGAGEIGDVHPDAFSLDSLLGLAYLVFVGSLVGYTAYTWLLGNAPISKVATYAYVNPVVAVFLGWLILDEVVPGTTLLATAVIVVSVAGTVRREATPRAPGAARSPGRPWRRPRVR